MKPPNKVLSPKKQFSVYIWKLNLKLNMDEMGFFSQQLEISWDSIVGS